VDWTLGALNVDLDTGPLEDDMAGTESDTVGGDGGLTSDVALADVDIGVSVVTLADVDIGVSVVTLSNVGAGASGVTLSGVCVGASDVTLSSVGAGVADVTLDIRAAVVDVTGAGALLVLALGSAELTVKLLIGWPAELQLDTRVSTIS